MKVIKVFCEESKLHEWTSFAFWFSVTKNLPDYEFNLICKRGNRQFLWPYRCNVKILRKKTQDGLYFTHPLHMAVRNTKDLSIVKPKSNEFGTFCDYGEGCGKFVVSQWINRDGGPLSCVRLVMNKDMSINESKIFDLWRNMFSLYQFVT